MLVVLSPGSVNRLCWAQLIALEVHAIDSEHEKNIQSQMWQTMAVFNALANPSSVVSKFATGNFQTLPEPQVVVDSRAMWIHRQSSFMAQV